MPKIYVKKAFKLQHEGKTHEFPVGNHSVPTDIAGHWFVQAHTGNEPPPDPGAAAAADELMAELEAKAKDIDARERHIAGMEKAMGDHMTDLTDREEALAARVKEADHRDAGLNSREAAVAEREKAAEAKQAGKASK